MGKKRTIAEGDERRVNIKVSSEELRVIKLSADLYANGNISRLIRHLVLSVLPRTYDAINRDKFKVPLKVVRPSTPALKIELQA